MLVDARAAFFTVPAVDVAAMLPRSRRAAALMLAFAAVLIGAFLTCAPSAAASDREVELVESWPPANGSLWIPPRSGNLVFSGPVQLASARISAFGPGLSSSGVELERLTKGRATRFLEFALPLTDPGSYRVEYSVRNATTGERLEGELSFEVQERASSVGGGNHRHDAGHIFVDSPEQLLLRFSLVLGAALVLFATLAYRARGSGAGRAAARLGGAMIFLGSATAAASLTYTAVTEAVDSPFAAVAATPAFWLFVPSAFAGAFEVVLARRDKWAAALALFPLFVVAASTDHGTEFLSFVLTWVYALALAAAALVVAAAVDAASAAVRPSVVRVLPATALLWSSVLLATLSLLLLPMHARGFEFNGDFRLDLVYRATACAIAVGLSFALWASLRVRGRQWAAALSVFLSLALCAASAATLLLPPPTAGL